MNKALINAKRELDENLITSSVGHAYTQLDINNETGHKKVSLTFFSEGRCHFVTFYNWEKKEAIDSRLKRCIDYLKGNCSYDQMYEWIMGNDIA